MEIYIDLAIALNFFIDLLLLLAVNRLSGFPPAFSRCLAGAVFGSLYGCLCLLPGLTILAHPVFHVLALGIMSLTAFGFRESTLRRTALFILLSLSLGGMAMALHKSRLDLLLLEAFLLWLLTRLAFGSSHAGAEYVPVTVRHQGRIFRFTALRDTGNQLTDPVTGKSVLILSSQQSSRLTGLSEAQISHPLETITAAPLKGLRLIPCCTAAGSSLLLALEFPFVTIGTREGSRLIAFAPARLGVTGMAEALTGGTVCC